LATEINRPCFVYTVPAAISFIHQPLYTKSGLITDTLPTSRLYNRACTWQYVWTIEIQTVPNVMSVFPFTPLVKVRILFALNYALKHLLCLKLSVEQY
jgi:hypothetical protein